MSDIVYRTNGPWGSGLGADLTSTQVDTNFWILYSLIIALQDAEPDMIDFFTVTGDQMYITMTDHFVFGPFTIPTAVFNFTGPFQANTSYNVNDVFTANGAIYIVIFPQLNSGSTFYAQANDGAGHNFYSLMLAAPPNTLPATGEPGQFLQFVSTTDSPGGMQWAYQTAKIGMYIEDAPNANETVLRYEFVEATMFPTGLAGSKGSAGTEGTGTQEYQIYQNDANIGTIAFTESPTDTCAFTFPDQIIFNPGDILTIVAPTVPDPHMTQISFTLLGYVVI